MRLCGRDVHWVRIAPCMVMFIAGCRCDGGPNSLGGIVGLTVGDVLVVAFPARVVLFVAWMDEPFMSDEEVAAREGFGTDVANEWFLFGMCANVSLQMLLQAVLAS